MVDSSLNEEWLRHICSRHIQKDNTNVVCKSGIDSRELNKQLPNKNKVHYSFRNSRNLSLLATP